MDDCNTVDNGPELPVHDDEQMRLLVQMAKDAKDLGVTTDLGFRRFMKEFAGYSDAEQATQAWRASGGTVLSDSTGVPSYGAGSITKQSDFMRDVILTDTGNAKPATRGKTPEDAKSQALRERLDNAAARPGYPKPMNPEGPQENMTRTLGQEATGATTTPEPSRLTSDTPDPVSTPSEQLAEKALDVEVFGEKTVFEWSDLAALGERITTGYMAPGTKGRDPKLKEELAYYGGYIYERLARMNSKRPAFPTWVAYMKASTGHDIAPQDLLDAWQTMRQLAWKTRVGRDVDIRNAAMRRATKTLSPEAIKQFIEDTKDIDPKSKDAHKKFREAIDNLRKDDPMQLVWELPGMRRGIRTSFDISAPFMQGSIYTLDPLNSKVTARNISDMLKAFANDKYAQAVMADLHSRKSAQEINKFAPGLLSQFGADIDITSHEEAYATRFFDAIAESSYENRPYSAYNSVQALPSIMAGVVGVPLTLVAGPLVGLPAGALAGMLGNTIAQSKPGKTGEIQSSISLDLSTGAADAIATMIQKAFNYQPKEGEAIETWDKRVSRELGVFGMIPGTNRNGKGLKTIGVQGAVSSTLRQGARMMRASERSYTVFLNLQRVQAWERVTALMKASGILPDTHPEAYQALGRVVGAFTGRADLGKVEDASKYLSWIFYSPRFQWARVQSLVTLPAKSALSAVVEKVGTEPAREKYASAMGGRMNIPPAVRKEVYQGLARAFAGLGILLSLAIAGGAAVYLDARHRDFMKARFNNVTLDFSGGMANWLRLLWQTMFAQEKIAVNGNYSPDGVQLPGDTTGQKVTKLTGENMGQTTRENFEQQIAGKENPLIADFWQLHSGRDIFGNPIYRGRFDKKSGTDYSDPEDWKGVAKDMAGNFGPLSPVDLIGSLSNEDYETKEKLISFLSILGVNVRANKYKKP